MNDNDSILQKIRRLIALAEGTQYEAEAASAWAKAQELMTRYAIDEAVARASGQQTTDKVVHKRVDYFGNKKYNKQKGSLFSTVCFYNRCKMFYSYQHDYMWVVGMERDVAFCEMLWTSLLLESWRWMLSDFSGYKKGPADWFGVDEELDEPKHVPRAIYLKNWQDGFRERVRERLRQHKEYIEAQHSTTIKGGAETVALALRNTDALIEAHLNANFSMGPGKRSRGSGHAYSSSANSAGRAAGDRADISGGRKVGRGDKPALPG